MSLAGMTAVSFGPPTEEERRHDFFWRIRRALPAAGYVGVFNRSHYEDVLIARVRNLVSEQVWSQRYDAINAFEAEQASEDAVNRCSTTVAPWYVVPADRKWYRDWAVATLLRAAFADIEPQYPEPDFDVAAERAKLLAAP